jgi:peptidoglycan/xylan/chitin deacetylase (PgdA/CDA1 family)
MTVSSHPRCTIALGYDCDIFDHHLLDLCSVADDRGARLQFFAQGMSFEQPCDCLREIAARGHDIDQHTWSHISLIDASLAEVEDEIARTNAAFEERLGFRPVGLRAPDMYRNGIQDRPDVQEMILRQGLGFVSSDYSTRLRSHAHDKAADDNAARNMKHLQPRWYPGGGEDTPRLLEIPAPGYSDRDFLDNLHGSVDDWIAHIKACIEFAYNLGGLIYAPHLHVDTHLRHDPELRVIRAIFDYAVSFHEPVGFYTYRDIYAHCRSSCL